MKKLKNKLFYFNSFLIYMVLVIISIIVSFVYLEPGMKNFFLANFAANKVGSPNVIEIIIGDSSISKYPWPWANNMYTELLDYFETYA